MWTTLGLACLISSCQISGSEGVDGSITEIRNGSSFGMCGGYCRTELTIDRTKSVLFRKAWDWNSTYFPDQRIQRDTNAAAWHNLVSLVDFDVIWAMKDVYGCPDCADGGSEWIEVTHNGDTKKVTFEFGSVLEPIAPLVDSLRSIRSDFLDELSRQ